MVRVSIMKHRFFSKLTKLSLSTGLAVFLAACGGGSSGSTGTLNLAITDAPVDDATSVVVQFTGVELNFEGKDELIVHNFTGIKEIDLLALTNGKTEILLDELTLEAGSYSWMRLKVNAVKDVNDSYIDLKNGDRYGLYVPSGSQSGLKLNSGFVVPAGGVTSFVIDFDLRKSIHKPSGVFPDYILKPTLRIVDINNAGKLTGTIATDSIPAGGECAPAVYVFNEGDNVDDIYGESGPITTTLASENEDGSFDYTVALLEDGNYTIAFTCDSANDLPDSDETLVFSGETTVTIVQGETTQSDF